MSYSHIGAPTEFNGTDPNTGGNSGEKDTVGTAWLDVKLLLTRAVT